MTRPTKEKHILFLLSAAAFGWLIPGAGHLFIKEKTRAIIIFITVTLTFCTGIYIGSIGVIDSVGQTPWYVYFAQVMTCPLVIALGHYTAGGGFPAFGWPNEFGQIYTSTAGLLNLLCIINAVYLANLLNTEPTGE